MDYVIFSSVYKDFRDAILDNIPDMTAMSKRVSAAIPPICNILNIGFIKIKLIAPSSIIARNGLNQEQVMYEDPNGFESMPIIQTYRTGENGMATIEIRAKKSHKFTPPELQAAKLISDDIFIILGRSRLMSAIHYASQTDTMTGAPNTAQLVHHSIELKAKNKLQNFSGLFLNLKNYKYINQSKSPAIGDMGITCFTRSVMAMCHDDEMIARLGGDNFFVLVKKENRDIFVKALSSMNVSVTVPHGPTIPLTIQSRIGVYDIQPQDSMNEIMHCSSVALNESRLHPGNDIVYFTKKMLEDAYHEKEISSLFREALRRKEFIVYYQPKVSVKDQKLCGCEALVRWNRNGQVIPPSEFLPILEKEASICLLDFYVFRKVCEDIRYWLDAGIEPVRVSSNFSRHHLGNPHLTEDILAIMKEYNIDSKFIEIELTESSNFEDKIAMQKFVNGLRQHGISVSIDDFGTGYSTFAAIKDLNVNVIKLDKSLLDHIGDEKYHDEVVIKNMVNMINELHLEVVAEGVENSKQLDFLQNAKCSIIQGFLFDKPLTKEDFEKRLSNEVTYTHIS
ncbi:putative bifunctional diguanylate cyclase/phosphodiesterase [Fibrobacter succinogenes]|uniref:Diguanylate cyclase (GGDEF) domain-containing protein n=1 Tax=Fibrobacter succinogenes TaxID=833 RepID=A0A380RUQ1_FIBSU|nr:GGDEF domain-containing protein [Fibrobacter succinogenes]PWJ36770.1 diguanylate cyclase (GGDEF)-like protein [Fibrobacter succinogenes subsp. elongatus]SUQ19019.1 diguanylate cyclase (GGDEF) domain-containing protein [Fibrobacter succinogenes]